MTRPTRSATQDVPPESVGLLQIFALFAQIGLTSFGGGLSAWIYQEVVVRRGWLREGEFIAGLTLAQVLPGPNVINIAPQDCHGAKTWPKTPCYDEGCDCTGLTQRRAAGALRN